MITTLLIVAVLFLFAGVAQLWAVIWAYKQATKSVIKAPIPQSTSLVVTETKTVETTSVKLDEEDVVELLLTDMRHGVSGG